MNLLRWGCKNGRIRYHYHADSEQSDATLRKFAESVKKFLVVSQKYLILHHQFIIDAGTIAQ